MANFTPTFKGYSGQQPFRFWCQTVLPSVYDDSLSYYELLNKVVDSLNKVISDNENMEDNVNALLSAYNELQAYVNNYFDNLDVQTEIDNKLDEMAENGTLMRLMQTYIGSYATPEMYGAIGDGISDDTIPIQTAINNHSYIMLSKKYLITQPINIPHKVNIYAIGSELTANDCDIFTTNNTRTEKGSIIIGGKYTTNKTFITVSMANFKISYVDVFCNKGIVAQNYEVFCDNSNFTCNNRTNAVCITSVGDCHYTDIIALDYPIVVSSNPSSTYTRIHAWITKTEYVDGSVFSARGGEFIGCYADTYQCVLDLQQGRNKAIFIGLRYSFNQNIYTSDVPEPTLFKFLNTDTAKDFELIGGQIEPLYGRTTNITNIDMAKFFENAKIFAELPYKFEIRPTNVVSNVEYILTKTGELITAYFYITTVSDTTENDTLFTLPTIGNYKIAKVRIDNEILEEIPLWYTYLPVKHALTAGRHMVYIVVY